MRLALIIIAAAFFLLAFGLWLSKGAIVESQIEKAFARAESRLQTELSFRSVEVHGVSVVDIHGIEMGEGLEPRISIETLSVELNTDAMWGLRVEPELVRLIQPVIRVRSHGNPLGLYRAAKALLPEPSRAAPAGNDATQPNPPSKKRRIPAIQIEGFQFLDEHGLVEVAGGTATILERRIQGAASIKKPSLGQCHVAGSFDSIEVKCDQHFAQRLPGNLQLQLDALQFDRLPSPTLRIPSIKVAPNDDGAGLVASIMGGMSANLSVGLSQDSENRWPLTLGLALPGGGQIIGGGSFDLETMSLSAEVEKLALGSAHEAISGQLGGRYTLSIDRSAKTVLIKGDGQIRDLRLEHRAIADGPIGPFTVGVGGRLEGVAKSFKERHFSIALEDGQFSLGQIKADFGGAVEAEGGEVSLEGQFNVPMLSGDQLSESIPAGLLPHIQPFKTKGQIGLNAYVKIDSRDYQATKLKIDVPKKRFAFTSINRAINFDRLRHQFNTEFEVPTGPDSDPEIQTRIVGPQSDRWLEPDEIHPLLPLAIMAQEDGGFYKHSGISMYHLRGSLILNMEKGRFARGGSTITMQLARNLFLNRRKTLARKLEELVLAWLLESHLDKDEMLALYMNVVEFGPDIYGVKEAAAHYFDKDALSLTPPEIAWLVRLLPGPRLLYPMFQKGRLTRGHTRSINRLLRFLVKKEFLAEEDATPIEPDGLWPQGTGGRPKKTPPRRSKPTPKALDAPGSPTEPVP